MVGVAPVRPNRLIPAALVVAVCAGKTPSRRRTLADLLINPLLGADEIPAKPRLVVLLGYEIMVVAVAPLVARLGHAAYVVGFLPCRRGAAHLLEHGRLVFRPRGVGLVHGGVSKNRDSADADSGRIAELVEHLPPRLEPAARVPHGNCRAMRHVRHRERLAADCGAGDGQGSVRVGHDGHPLRGKDAERRRRDGGRAIHDRPEIAEMLVLRGLAERDAYAERAERRSAVIAALAVIVIVIIVIVVVLVGGAVMVFRIFTLDLVRVVGAGIAADGRRDRRRRHHGV